MCFSASASFISGGVLAAIGGYSVASNRSRMFLPFAAIPFYFALQQFIEGLLWLSFTEPTVQHWQHELTYFFLLFAQVFWPIYVPWSIYYAEKNEKTKKILFAILGIGVVVGGYLAFCLAAYPVSVKIQGNHLLYLLDYPEFNLNYKGILYFIATVFPPFFSTLKGMRWFGVLVFISLMITQIFFPGFEISVWCFFAALISASIPVILNSANNQRKEIPVD